MILRISTEGQYRLSGALADRLGELDDRIVAAIARGDKAEFHKSYGEMISLVRKEGTPLPPDELAQSEMVLPPSDITLEEAKDLFAGTGLVPD